MEKFKINKPRRWKIIITNSYKRSKNDIIVFFFVGHRKFSGRFVRLEILLLLFICFSYTKTTKRIVHRGKFLPSRRSFFFFFCPAVARKTFYRKLVTFTGDRLLYYIRLYT